MQQKTKIKSHKIEFKKMTKKILYKILMKMYKK